MNNIGIILLYHNEDNVRSYIATELINSGCDVLLAHSYEKSLELLKENEVDLVLADIETSDKMKLDVIVEFKRIKPKLPVVMITNNEITTIDCEQAKYYGAAACLPQNADTEDIRGLIADIFHLDNPKVGRQINNNFEVFTEGTKVNLEVITGNNLGSYPSIIIKETDKSLELLAPNNLKLL